MSKKTKVTHYNVSEETDIIVRVHPDRLTIEIDLYSGDDGFLLSFGYYDEKVIEEMRDMAAVLTTIANDLEKDGLGEREKE